MNNYNFVQELVNSENGIISINEYNPLIEVMLKGKYTSGLVSSYFGKNNENRVVYEIFKVNYESDEINQDILKARNNVFYCIFARWEALGLNKRRCKNPYNSKSFVNFCKSNYSTSNSVYVLVNMEY